ncbi:Phage tail fibers [Citrobacter portucalensis]|nr:Phage tail fibers [Citrobacter portucalensis]
MTTYNTGNPLGSAAAKDLYDNAQNFDHLVNDLVNETNADRFGVPRLTWYGMEQRYKTALANLGFNPVGTFQGGAVINSAGDIIQDETTDAWYRWDDLTTLPKTVPSGSTPDSSGGIGSGKWLAVDVSDVLRKQISDPDGATKYPELQIARLQDGEMTVISVDGGLYVMVSRMILPPLPMPSVILVVTSSFLVMYLSVRTF